MRILTALLLIGLASETWAEIQVGDFFTCKGQRDVNVSDRFGIRNRENFSYTINVESWDKVIVKSEDFGKRTYDIEVIQRYRPPSDKLRGPISIRANWKKYSMRDGRQQSVYENLILTERELSIVTHGILFVSVVLAKCEKF